MIRENLRRANEINEEIKRLEKEINFLDNFKSTKLPRIVKINKPEETAWEVFFCLKRDIGKNDTRIRSSIYLDHEECVALADYKRMKIVRLEEEYKELDMSNISQN